MYINKGFTLIELLIVVTIIGILTSIALYAYQVYVARTQISEVLVLADGMKSNLLADQDSSSCGTGTVTGKYGTGIVRGTPPNCTITFTFNNSNVSPALISKVIGLDVAANQNLLSNSDTTVDAVYLPSSIK